MLDHQRHDTLCPVLIGRSEELATVGVALEGVERGEGTALLVTGEAGIGKSRLARAAAEEARGKGIEVLAEAMLELGTIDLLSAAPLDRLEQTRELTNVARPAPPAGRSPGAR